MYRKWDRLVIITSPKKKLKQRLVYLRRGVETCAPHDGKCTIWMATLKNSLQHSHHVSLTVTRQQPRITIKMAQVKQPKPLFYVLRQPITWVTQCVQFVPTFYHDEHVWPLMPTCPPLDGISARDKPQTFISALDEWCLLRFIFITRACLLLACKSKCKWAGGELVGTG